MRSLTAFAILLVLSFGPSSVARSVSAQTDKEPGSISGLVKVDGKPARGIIVIATRSVTDSTNTLESMSATPTSFKATTDADGIYKFDDLPSDRYRLIPFAPLLLNDSGESGIEVMVTAGKQTEDIEFSLSSGGVITGRVTDVDGRPVISESISLMLADDPNASAANSTSAMMSRIATRSGRMYTTDDRGIYRIFGVGAGRYLVSAGGDADFFSTILSVRPKRSQTFYPGVTDKARAKPVQITAGSETAGIDIQFTHEDQGFDVTGRVIDAENGSPIAGTMVGYSKARSAAKGDKDQAEKDNDDDDLSGTIPGGLTTTNDKGGFRFKSVAPGRYLVEAAPATFLDGLGTNEFYADPVPFEVSSTNVDRLDIKVHRGASVSGIVVVENTDGQNGLESYGSMMLFASVTGEQAGSYSTGSAGVSPDGSFRIGGLRAGKATFQPMSMGGEQRPILLRIESNGVVLQGGVDIKAKEQISGLRIVITTANCVIRGHVTIQGGALPPGAILTATARPLEATGSFDILGRRSVEVNENGDFVIEELAPSIYVVAVSVAVPGRSGGQPVSTEQTVTTSRGTSVEAHLVLDLSGKSFDR